MCNWLKTSKQIIRAKWNAPKLDTHTHACYHICTHKHMHTCMYEHMHGYTNTCMHIHMHMHIHSFEVQSVLSPWKARSFLDKRREGDSGKTGILLLWASCVAECRTISMGQGQEVHARKLIQMSMQQVCSQGAPLFWLKHYHPPIHLVYLGSDSDWQHPSSDVHFPFVLHGQTFGHLWTLHLKAVFLLVAL